jgi:hypothetical protein
MEKQRKSPQRPQEPQEPQRPSVPSSAPLINIAEDALQVFAVWSIRIILICATVYAHLTGKEEVSGILGTFVLISFFFL